MLRIKQQQATGSLHDHLVNHPTCMLSSVTSGLYEGTPAQCTIYIKVFGAGQKDPIS